MEFGIPMGIFRFLWILSGIDCACGCAVLFAMLLLPFNDGIWYFLFRVVICERVLYMDKIALFRV